MLDEILSQFNDLPDVWGEGAIFAFSGLDGETCSESGFVATLGSRRYDLLWHTPRQRILTCRLAQPGRARVACGDVLAADTPPGLLGMAFAAWHTLIGVIPPDADLSLCLRDGPAATGQDGFWLSLDPQGQDCLALWVGEGRFALSFGLSAGQAVERARSVIDLDWDQVAQARLSFYHRLPTVESDHGHQRLLNKCYSVVKVNTLSAEGVIGQTWSTPDRVPHRHMWLWDSVFHSLAMNLIAPDRSFELLKSVLETQAGNGMISHMVTADGRRSAITQPPLLAWGIWENYLAYRQRHCLEYALPRLERYLIWNAANRDRNHNGLLEWFIEGDPLCRSGESGMDNSPRFDRATQLDAVDFSTFQSLDEKYVAYICRELGQNERASLWESRSRRISEQIHALLWDEQSGFYYDAEMGGRLSEVAAVSGLLPLLLDDIPTERVGRLTDKLSDSAWFDTAFPLPSVAVSDPRWCTDMWRGAAWINFNYLAIKGLLKQGKKVEAQRLICSTVAGVVKYYEQYGVLFEFFDAQDRLPPTQCDRKGAYQEPFDIRRKMDSIRDYHWTAALTARLLLLDGG